MKPGWGWAVIGSAALFAALATSAWYKQRPARQTETPKPAPAPPSRAGAHAMKPAPPAGSARNEADSGRSPRERPERERAGRP